MQKKVTKKESPTTLSYAAFFEQVKQKVRQAQVKATLAVNSELIKLYWDLGKSIVEKQEQAGWKTQIIEKLCNDLQNAFPGIEGFSRSNIFRMRAFYLAYARVAQAVPLLNELPIVKIPWGHNILLMRKIKNTQERLWYAQKAIDHGWSRVMLEHWIKTNLYKRDGKALTNFTQTLPTSHSDLAQQTLKDPYLFDFLTLHKEHLEQDLEQGLIDHIQKFLLELGQGFAFVGRQVHIAVSDKDFYIDLLFYHTKLHCYLVVELKTTEFDPRDAGQISFYLAAVDAQIKHPDDKPTIGLLLCKNKNKLIVEYALRSNISPLGIASYETKLVESLPKNLKNNLPTVAELEAEFGNQKFVTKKAPKKVVKKKR